MLRLDQPAALTPFSHVCLVTGFCWAVSLCGPLPALTWGSFCPVPSIPSPSLPGGFLIQVLVSPRRRKCEGGGLAPWCQTLHSGPVSTAWPLGSERPRPGPSCSALLLLPLHPSRSQLSSSFPVKRFFAWLLCASALRVGGALAGEVPGSTSWKRWLRGTCASLKQTLAWAHDNLPHVQGPHLDSDQ